jgi:hypothetical protein
MWPAQVAVFDLELQAPAASTKLPGGRPAFRAVLGAFGHASAGGALLSTGLDFLYCLHQVCGTLQQHAKLSAFFTVKDMSYYLMS